MKFDYDNDLQYDGKRFMSWGGDPHGLEGETITDVAWTEDDIIFTLETGRQVRWVAVGDCCSQSVIEHCDIQPGKFISIEFAEGPKEEHAEFDDVIRWHTVTVKTSGGTGVITFRNESNGWYDGQLVLDTRFGGGK